MLKKADREKRDSTNFKLKSSCYAQGMLACGPAVFDEIAASQNPIAIARELYVAATNNRDQETFSGFCS